jgi:hypothetical protein
MFDPQFEVLLQFCVAVYNEDLQFIDDWRTIALRNFLSIFGFWFDSATSIPWSFMDLHFYLVRSSTIIIMNPSDEPVTMSDVVVDHQCELISR